MRFYCMRLIILFLSVVLVNITQAQESNSEGERDIKSNIQKYVNQFINSPEFIELTGYNKKDSTVVDSVNIDSRTKTIRIYLDKQFAYAPFRESTVDSLIMKLNREINCVDKDFEIEIYTDLKEIHTLVPNYFVSSKKEKDSERKYGKLKRKTPPIVQNISKPDFARYSLYNTNIALWHSHGWYYEPGLHRWEWQRARLFNTVEDLYPMSFTMNFLVPMLENSGSNVFIPRERDWQTNEVIVDNDSSAGKSIFIANIQFTVIDSGFAIGNPPYINENPFKQGTSIKLKSSKTNSQLVEWIPEIPETGYYPVYISWQSSPESCEAVKYSVYHSGGVTNFMVNQQMGGGTWVYLGKFKFEKGLNETQGKVILSANTKRAGKVITADAVRFGGGMGNISRNGMVSNRPRYQEAARYYLQYAGFPDTLVWKLHQDPDNDYVDDYQSRGEWVDYLMNGSEYSSGSGNAGLGIPIDLSFAFHTDAGITDNDTVIGTLGIYSTKIDTPYFESGLSKLASRDLTDLIQTQIVNDIRIKYDSAWTRRGMWDKGYSEAYRPNTPSMLLELLSHQNLLDVQFAKEPDFQFDVSRAIYKGMVRFFASLYKLEYKIQPLPVQYFQAGFTEKGDIELNWEPQTDPLEETAKAEAYIVYTRKDSSGFDNGTLVEDKTFILTNIQPGVIYSFKVAAVNNGGESFPSEELSICKSSGSERTVLIVNAFDRLGGAASFNDKNYGGFLDRVDEGVPFMYDFHTVGNQFDFEKDSPWLDDDSPGFGASFADKEDKVYPGNTFNFSYIHGLSIRNAGYSFITVSDEAVEEGKTNLSDYKVVDFLAGEEKTSYLPKNMRDKRYQIYSPSMLKKLEEYLTNGGSLFISGSHIATDANINHQDAEIGSILKFKWRTSSASRKGLVYSVDNNTFGSEESFLFNTTYNPEIYTAEASDALEPFDSLGSTIFRYSENNISAGVKYNGKYKIVAIGFPFETIIKQKKRDVLMKQILLYFYKE